MKRTPILLVTAALLTLAGALYAQSRERSRSFDRGYDRGSDRSSDRSNDRNSGRSYDRSRSSDSSNTVAATSTSSSTAPAASRPAPVAYEPPVPGKPLPGDYILLARKSIFSKERRAYVDRPRGFETQRHVDTAPAPTPPPAVPVLVGVLIGDDDLIAYIEDPDTGKLWPIAAGDPLPGTYGSVKNVTLDDITIAADNGPPRHILIGQNLNGEAATSHTLTYSGSGSTVSTTSGSTTAPAIDPNDPNLTIEQKMKLRRMQQIGR